MESNELNFEQGPIRPPNEAQSLLLRFTRNCPWNHCLFCPVYKRRKFSLRSVDDIKQDIRTARAIADDVSASAQAMGFGEITLRYNPDAALPDGIPWPIRIDPRPWTYTE